MRSLVLLGAQTDRRELSECVLRLASTEGVGGGCTGTTLQSARPPLYRSDDKRRVNTTGQTHKFARQRLRTRPLSVITAARPVEDYRPVC